MNYFRPQRPGPTLSDQMLEQHNMVRSQLDNLEAVQQKQRVVREQLDHLTKLGDLISEDDVIESATHIVGQGVDPMEIAKLLATMPQGSPALQQWVGQQDQQVAQKEAQLGSAMNLLRHETGLAALRLLAAQHMGHMDEQTVASALPQGNSLMGQPSPGQLSSGPTMDSVQAPSPNPLMPQMGASSDAA